MPNKEQRKQLRKQQRLADTLKGIADHIDQASEDGFLLSNGMLRDYAASATKEFDLAMSGPKLSVLLQSIMGTSGPSKFFISSSFMAGPPAPQKGLLGWL